MATRVFAPHLLVGTSEEVKPTDCPAGSEFVEIDTGLMYMFDGAGTWGRRVYPTQPASQGGP